MPAYSSSFSFKKLTMMSSAMYVPTYIVYKSILLHNLAIRMGA
jgi:hypothetical protein